MDEIAHAYMRHPANSFEAGLAAMVVLLIAMHNCLIFPAGKRIRWFLAAVRDLY